jgi:trimethylamine:corrinoid methyltransferase-like protein
MAEREERVVPIRFKREVLITADQAARVHGLAKRILHEVGLEVRADRILERLKDKRLHLRGNRVLFEPAILDEHVDEMRRWIATQPPRVSMSEDARWFAFQPPPAPADDDGRLTLCVNPASQYVHDIETDRIVPYTTDRLIQMCKLIDTFADDAVYGAPPGTPPEVHPDLQPVAQYRIAALYARQGARLVYPISPKTAGYVLDMAEVLQKPFQSLSVFLTSPLRLAEESLDLVLSYAHRLSYIWVGSMPSTGATAPIYPFGALALAAAELMGGLVLVRLLTGKPVVFRVDIFPFDLRTLSVVFGSPESVFCQMLCRDINQYYGWPQSPAPYNIHVMSKLPDGQSAVERTAIMAIGAFLGARYFECAGTLGLEEVFSPEQLLLDCETRDWVQRAIQGLQLGEEAVEDWLLEIQGGLDKGFIGLDSTLDCYRRGQTWYPSRFERGVTGPWLAKGQPRLSNHLRAEVARRLSAYDFELDADRRREVDRIYRAAQRTVSE